MSRAKVIFPLHGIRTDAKWQNRLAELASDNGCQCRLDRWNFGRFSLLRFLSPSHRLTKVKWFRETYHTETRDRDVRLDRGDRPSVVAHSFGTYILGNALLKYDYLRFNKVILCGSILPRDFPWNEIIERGQVQAVRNEYGVNDFWTKAVGWFIRASGPSGAEGFTCAHARLEQERFRFDHHEYFERGHMEAKWLPFLNRDLPLIPPQAHPVQRDPDSRPYLLYLFYLLLLVGGCLLVWNYLIPAIRGLWPAESCNAATMTWEEYIRCRG